MAEPIDAAAVLDELLKKRQADTTERHGLEFGVMDDMTKEALARPLGVDITSTAQTLPRLTDRQTVAEMVTSLEKAGVIMPTQLPDHPFADEAAADGRAEYAKFMDKMGYWDTQYPGAADDKEDTKQNIIKLQTLRNAELTGRERTQMSASVVRKLVDTQVARVLEQASAGGVSPGQDEVTAAAAIAKQWTDVEMDEAIKFARVLHRPEPVNESDAQAFRDYLPWRGAVGKWVAAHRATRSVDTSGSARMPVEERMSILQTILGDTASKQLLDEMERQKVPYLMHKLGVDVGPDGQILEGFGPDSYSFQVFDKYGALGRLAEAKAKLGKVDVVRTPNPEESVAEQIRAGVYKEWAPKATAFRYRTAPMLGALPGGKESELVKLPPELSFQTPLEQFIPNKEVQEYLQVMPEEKAKLVQLANNGGSQAVDSYLKQILPRFYGWFADRMAMVVSQPERTEPGLTPFEKKVTPASALWLVDTMKKMGEAFMALPTAAARDLDQALGQVPPVREWAQEVVLAGTESPELARSIRTPAEAFKYLFRAMQDRGSIFPTGRFTHSAVQADPALSEAVNDDPATVKALLDKLNSPLAAFQEEHADAYTKLGERMANLNAQMMGREPFKPLKFLENLIGVSGAMTLQGIVEPIIMTVDDPTTAAGLLVSGKAATATSGAVRGLASSAYNRVMNGARLRDNLLQLARNAPQVAENLRTATGDALREALDRGDDAAIVRRLEAAHAVAKVAADDFKFGGRVGDARGVATQTARVWPFIADKMGSLGAALMDNVKYRNIYERVRGLWTNIVGDGNLDRRLAIQLSNDASDNSAAALESILAGKADSQTWAGAQESFVRALGREPTAEELVALAPEKTATLAGLLQAADEVGKQTSVFNWFARKVFGRRPVEIPLQEAQTLIYSTADTARKTIAARHQLGVKQIPNGILLDVVKAKLQARMEDTVTKEKALRTMLPHAGDTADAIQLEIDVLKRTKETTAHTLNIVRNAIDRVNNHDYRRPLDVFANDAIAREVDADTLNLILESNLGKYFSALARDRWFARIRRPAARVDVDAAALRAEGLNRRLQFLDEFTQKVQAQPERYDLLLNELSEKIQAGKILQRENAARGSTDPHLDARIADYERRFQARLAEVQAGDTPRGLTALKDARDLVVAEHRRALRHLDDLNRGYEFTQLRPGAVAELRESLAYKGVDESTEGAIRSVEELAAHVQGARALGVKGNPFVLAHLPSAKLGQTVHELVRETQMRNGAAELRANDLAAVLQEMTPGDRKLLARAQLDGREVPSQLLQKYPQLQVTDGGELADTYLFSERQFHETMMGILRGNRRFSPEFVKAMKDIGYDPHEFMAYARPGMVKEGEALAAIEGTSAEPARVMKMGLRIGGEQWEFARDYNLWRVQVLEPETRVNLKFKSREEAETYLKRRYGWQIMDKAVPDGDDLVGWTPYHDKFVIAAPWSAETKAALRPLVGATPELRLKHVTNSMKDAMIVNLTDALNLFGTRVIDEAAYQKLVQKYGKRGMALFQKMPSDPAAVGALAGKYVHKEVLGELNRAASTFESLNALLDGVRKAYMETHSKLPRWLSRAASGMVGSVYDATTEIARSNLITYSPRTWIANVAFNAVLDHASPGPKAYSTDNIHNIMTALQELLPRLKGRGPKGTLERHPWFEELRADGQVTGLHSEEQRPFKEMMLRVLGMTEKDAADLQAEVQKLKTLQQKLFESTAEGDKTKSTQLRREIAAVESALAEAEKGRWSKAGRYVTSFFYKTRDNFGMSENRFAEFMKKMYNVIDEHYKTAKYFALRESGMSREAALHHLRLFSQQYQDVPVWLRGLPFRSMVVSFPYELGRITKNLMAHNPTGLLGVLAVIPSLNMLQLARSGMDTERFMAMLDQRGNKNSMSQALALMTNLFMIDPKTKSLTSELDFGGWLPYMDTVIGQGPAAAALNNWFPPEKRTLLQSIGTGAGSYLGSFILNHPLLTSALVGLTGRDPRTGQLLVDDSAGPSKKIGYTLKAMAQALVPAALWGSIDGLATDRVESPKTERPFRDQEPFTKLFRTWSGVGVKGMAAQIGNYLAGIGPNKRVPLTGDRDLLLDIMFKVSAMTNKNGDKANQPLYGRDREMREFYYRSIDAARSADDRTEAQKQLDALLREQTERAFAGFKAQIGKTDRQVEMAKQSIEEQGVMPYFKKLPINAQAIALVWADASKVNDKMVRDLTIAMTTSNFGRPREYDDPDTLYQAVETLRQYLDQNPGANVRLRGLYNTLLPSILISRMKAARRDQRKTISDMKKQLIEELLYK